MQLSLKATIPDVAFKTKRFTARVEVLFDPFPDEFYQHFKKIGKSNEARYRHFDAMVDAICMAPKTKDRIRMASLYASAREYYRSKCRMRRRS